MAHGIGNGHEEAAGGYGWQSEAFVLKRSYGAAYMLLVESGVGTGIIVKGVFRVLIGFGLSYTYFGVISEWN